METEYDGYTINYNEHTNEWEWYDLEDNYIHSKYLLIIIRYIRKWG